MRPLTGRFPVSSSLAFLQRPFQLTFPPIAAQSPHDILRRLMAFQCVDGSCRSTALHRTAPVVLGGVRDRSEDATVLLYCPFKRLVLRMNLVSDQSTLRLRPRRWRAERIDMDAKTFIDVDRPFKPGHSVTVLHPLDFSTTVCTRSVVVPSVMESHLGC